MPISETLLQPPNLQGLDIRSTPREEMNLYSLDTFPYEFPGREIKINLEIPEFTCICPFSDFPDFATIRIEYVLCAAPKPPKRSCRRWRAAACRRGASVTPTPNASKPKISSRRSVRATD